MYLVGKLIICGIWPKPLRDFSADIVVPCIHSGFGFTLPFQYAKNFPPRPRMVRTFWPDISGHFSTGVRMTEGVCITIYWSS